MARTVRATFEGFVSATASTGESKPSNPWMSQVRSMFSIEPDTAWCFDPDLAELERLSNGVLELIGSGHLEEAERGCLEIRARFPDQIDWIERSAAVCEARGQVERAIEFHRRCLDHIDRHPECFDADSREWYRSRIERLRRPATGESR